jgi:hypothetical protein
MVRPRAVKDVPSAFIVMRVAVEASAVSGILWERNKNAFRRRIHHGIWSAFTVLIMVTYFSLIQSIISLLSKLVSRRDLTFTGIERSKQWKYQLDTTT